MTILINILLAIWMLVALLMMLVIPDATPEKSEELGRGFRRWRHEEHFSAPKPRTSWSKFTTAGWPALFFILTFVLSILYAHKSQEVGTALFAVN